MDLRLLEADPTQEERTAVDAVLGPPRSAWDGGAFDAASGRIARGGHQQRRRRHQLLPALHALRDATGRITEGGLGYVCERLTIPPAEAYGVATFYALLGTEDRPDHIVHLCDDIACAGRGAAPSGDASIVSSPCLGACDQPAAALADRAGAPLASLTRTPAVPQDPASTVLLRRVGVVDPADFDGYLAAGGGRALHRARTEGAEAVLDDLDRSGLLGRGGAAFPIAAKWRSVRETSGTDKHVIANGDESEPGTFKDRVLMESDPHAVVEGLLVGAVTTGANRAWIYVRAEYPDAIERLRHAVGGFEAAGLADGIETEVRVGAGAYICGEETALFASIEGHRGEPRQKPPYPVTSGLFGEPTAINNIETLVAAVAVLADGPAAFRAIGTERSTGPKLFSISGDVAAPGVYEVPFGISLSALIDLAGGAPDGVDAVLLGGAAGGFVGAGALDVPLSLEGASAAGATLGSGAVVVFRTGTDFGPIVRRIAAFFRDESCGTCVPCRVGTVRQHEALHRLGAGAPIGSVDGELALLADLDTVMTEASICGLGRTASSAVRTALALGLRGVIA